MLSQLRDLNYIAVSLRGAPWRISVICKSLGLQWAGPKCFQLKYVGGGIIKAPSQPTESFIQTLTLAHL